MTVQSDSGPADGRRYTRIAILLHWLIATCILFNLSIGYFMEGFGPPWRFLTVGLHVSAGISVLALTAIRIVWRLLHAPPPYPAEMKSWERNTAHLTHFMLYAMMIIMPLTGWMIVSANPAPGTPGEAYFIANQPKPKTPEERAKALPPRKPGQRIEIKIWGVVPLPMIAPIQEIGNQPGGVPPLKILHDKFAHWHALASYVMITLFLLHIAGALKHQFVDRQPEFARMAIRRHRRRSNQQPGRDAL